ncbi:MAG: GNAT family N-acetyltransferase [Clostridia bacterium]|nr:GNAT family N-acetyltransferase [Clostridia bacterium]
MSELSIRFAGREDIPTLLAMIRELADYEHMLDAVVADPDEMAAWMFERQVAECLIAEEDGVPVGMALFFHNYSTWLGKAGIYLEDLYVKPKYRGRGYGKALLARLAAITVERKCGRLEWACLDWNTPSIGFYRALGAVPMDEWTTYRLTGEALDTLAGEVRG